jgi:hypothetical protein
MIPSSVLPAIERILLTLWVGGLWVTGLLFAPVLFSGFERMLAGEIAGRLFSVMSLAGLACGAVLLALAAVRAGMHVWRDWRVLALAMMLLLALLGEFGIGARMRELRMLTAHHAEAVLWAEFGRLHGLASALYLVECVLGLLLVVFGPRPRAQAGS